MAKFEKIGILTSGGDAPGMNAAIRAAARHAIYKDMEVIGIREGYEGLLTENYYEMKAGDVSKIITRAGTILYSSRSPRFATPEGMQIALEFCSRKGIDAIVAMGGDGTFRGATKLTNNGIPSIGIPCTIDNDITATEYTIGFDTAMNTVLTMVDALRETCESHKRCNVIEVMGRDCGLLALYTGIATGALAIAIPEIPFDEKAALEKLATARRNGKRGMVVIVSEGMKSVNGTSYGEYLTEKIMSETKIETRFNRCGHVIRGGAPSQRDRMIATQMGYCAIDELLAGHSNEVICYKQGNIVPCEINYALTLDHMYKKTLADEEKCEFTPAQLDEMNEICDRRRAKIERLYNIAGNISF